jgi:ADP-heptose:LPS heptosyltransferase
MQAVYRLSACLGKIICVILGAIMRILINASTSIGDSLYFSFMLDNIYRYYPEASIQLLCWHPMVAFYKTFTYLEQVIPYNQVAKDERFALFLLYPKIDMFIDLQHTIESADVCKASRAKFSIGVNPHPDKHDCYDYCIVPAPGEHIYDAFYRGFCRLWPEKDIVQDLQIRIDTRYEDEARALLSAHDIVAEHEYVVVHPGAKGTEKLWDNAKWAHLVCYLFSRDLKVVLIGSQLREWGGAQVRDREQCGAIHTLCPEACSDLSGQVEDLRLLSALLKRARLYCGLDTGPTHLASLLDVPVIEIYKFIDENTFSLWRPYGQKTRVISHVDCRHIEADTVIYEIEKELDTDVPAFKTVPVRSEK